MGAWSTWSAGPTVKGKPQHIVWRTVRVSVTSFQCHFRSPHHFILSSHVILSPCHRLPVPPRPPLGGVPTCSVQHPPGCITQEHGCPAGPPPAPPWKTTLQAAQPQSCGAAVPHRSCGGERTDTLCLVGWVTSMDLLCLPASHSCSKGWESRRCWLPY